MTTPEALERTAEWSALDELAAVIGRPAAQELANLLGGRLLYFPKTGPMDPEVVALLVAQLGEIAFARLAKHYAGSMLSVPRPPTAEVRAAWVRRLRAERCNFREISEKVGVSERRVRQILGI